MISLIILTRHLTGPDDVAIPEEKPLLLTSSVTVNCWTDL